MDYVYDLEINGKSYARFKQLAEQCSKTWLFNHEGQQHLVVLGMSPPNMLLFAFYIYI